MEVNDQALIQEDREVQSRENAAMFGASGQYYA